MVVKNIYYDSNGDIDQVVYKALKPNAYLHWLKYLKEEYPNFRETDDSEITFYQDEELKEEYCRVEVISISHTNFNLRGL